MKVDLRDKQVLEALQPMDVAAYLKSRGWIEYLPVGQPWTVFRSQDFEIALPLRKDLRDYALRMAEALKTLEIAEERDQLTILTDLSVSSADIVRVRIIDADTNDGTLRLTRASELVSGAKDMMLAAACAAVDPKIYYPSRKPQPAIDYLHNVRMGQTERGSFVISLLARVPPRLIGDAEQSQLGIAEPFERRVTDTLADALSTIERASYEAVTTGDLAPFEAAVPHGVSANLCAALAGLTGADGRPRNVYVGLSWARSRQPRHAATSQFSVSSDWSSVLKEAARILKQKAPREDFDLLGPVFRLVKDPNVIEGDVTVRGQVDDEPRSIWMRLAGADYQTALEAHAAARLLRASGELCKENGRYRLRFPRDVAIVDDEAID